MAKVTRIEVSFGKTVQMGEAKNYDFVKLHALVELVPEPEDKDLREVFKKGWKACKQEVGNEIEAERKTYKKGSGQVPL